LVNAPKNSAAAGAVLLLGLIVLTAAAWLRGAEYDEQYTLFLTAGVARPVWPDGVFPAGVVAAAQAGHASAAQIAADLRATDVHPPLYFWAVALWRAAFGPELFTARLFSVLCGVASLGLVGVIARQCRIRPAAAMLLTLGCYGFVYTNAIARGFAPAETACLAGMALLLARRPVLAGVAFGLACGCNYLAVFVAMAAIAATGAWSALFGATPFLALDAWFFAAQHGARPEQFPPFAVLPSLLRLAGYQAAAVFGGLPLYVEGLARLAVGGAIGLVAAVLAVRMARTLPGVRGLRPLLAAAAAPAAGLLLLGVVFNTTPIELRYLAFGLPFLALLLARATAPATAAAPLLRAAVLCLQLAGIAGLLLAPGTMQPMRAAATEAARLAGDGVVLLPRGNDGVGLVGAFGIEAPAALKLRLVRPGETVTAPGHRVVLVLLGRDRDSIATLSALREVVAGPGWRRVAGGAGVEVHERNEVGVARLE
jgi:Dolichyl-phosphate-mannose-protein mannosyltransferase